MVRPREPGMLAFLTKNELFKGLHALPETGDLQHLKYLQDTWFKRFFKSETPQRVIEIGGGASRTLPALSLRGVECWNADKMEGIADGPMAGDPALAYMQRSGIKIVPVYVGDFSPELPGDYFDIGYSISVLEHLNADQLTALFKDAARVLKPGGRLYHSVDLFLDNKPLKRTSDQINFIRQAAAAAGLEPIGKDEAGPNPIYKTTFATPSDVYLSRKWCFNPTLQSMVENYALTALQTGHRKPA